MNFEQMEHLPILLLPWLTLFSAEVQIGLGLGLVRTDNISCVCPGDVIVYECAVTTTGTLATVWQGSAFDCPENENMITLYHNLFRSMSRMQCNNGSMVAQEILSTENLAYYTSQLRINMDSSFDGRNVECAVSDGGSITVLYTANLALTTEPYNPPSNTRCTSIPFSDDHLTFTWNSAATNCPSLKYRLMSNNACGNCTNGTDVTQPTVTCTNLTSDGDICTFSVKSVICGNIVSDAGYPLIIPVKGDRKGLSFVTLAVDRIIEFCALLLMCIFVLIIRVCVVQCTKRLSDGGRRLTLSDFLLIVFMLVSISAFVSRRRRS